MVKATVYDITDPDCALPQSMFYDTNAWLDLFYPPFSVPGTTRASSAAHSAFFSRCLSHDVTLLRSSFSFPEIAHVIEGEETRAYSARMRKAVGAKQGRGMLNLRRNVVSNVVRAWKDIEGVSSPHPGLMADDALAARAVVRFGTQALDGYDLFVVEQVLDSDDKSILTDDADYLTVPGLKLYTANRHAIQKARETNRLR